MKKWKIAVRMLTFVGCAVLLLYGLTVLLKDKRVTFDYDTTRKVEGFYAEEKNSLDFVFIGSSQMFTSVVPAVLWEEYGITSYDFGANEQPMYLSYYYIKEALKYQDPRPLCWKFPIAMHRNIPMKEFITSIWMIFAWDP